MVDESQLPDMSMAAGEMYQEEVFTDRTAGSIRRLTPVTAAGERDDSRDVLYLGETQLMTQAGALPLNFEIPAQSLDEAVGKFGEHADAALKQTLERLEEMRREQASGLYVPGQGGGGMPGGGGGMPGGGAPGGGSPGGGIQFR